MTSADTTTQRTLDAAATAAALESSATVRWWQTTTFLRVAGPDAVTLVDGLCTQAVERIAPGTSALALFLDAKAKIIAPARIHRDDATTWTDPKRGEVVTETTPVLLLETLPDIIEPLAKHLSRYRLRARVSIDADELGTISIVGTAADGADLPEADGRWYEERGGSLRSWTFVGTTDACSRLIAGALPAGVALADPDTFEAHRITAGTASLHDLLPGRMPAEVGGMEHAVALDAGCYLGQEPVARLHYRGRSNRSLRRLVADAPLEVAAMDPEHPEDALELRAPDAASESRACGRLTTWATAVDGSTVALAILRRELQQGDVVRLPQSDVDLRVVDPAPDPS